MCTYVCTCVSRSFLCLINVNVEWDFFRLEMHEMGALTQQRTACPSVLTPACDIDKSVNKLMHT